jgi:hypothetical protein
MAYTYYGLRWGLCLAALLLPIVARVGERLLTHHSLPGSISGYYHTGMRNYFVATLILIAGFLFLYKGFSKWENYLLNLAGVATAGIVFFPTGCDSGATECATFTRQHRNRCGISRRQYPRSAETTSAKSEYTEEYIWSSGRR